MTTDDTTKIRDLNDQFRRTLDTSGGKRFMTRGIAALPFTDQAAILGKVMSFDAFTPDNDPHKSMISGALRTKGRSSFGKSSTTTRLANSAPKTPPTPERACAFSPSCWPKSTDRGRGRPTERPLCRVDRGAVRFDGMTLMRPQIDRV